MFEPTSRYYHLKDVKVTSSDGVEIVYKPRRLLPPSEAYVLLGEVTVQQGERLDQITGRVLGDSELFWRLCDANETMNPLDLTAEPGTRLKVPLPQPQ